MKKIKHLLSLLSLGAFAFLFYECAPTKDAPPAPKVKFASFKYNSASDSVKTGITLALVNPEFARNMKHTEFYLFKDFASHMGIDFEELITKRAYTLRGPFLTSDDMVFSDKQACLLYLHPEIDINFDLSQLHVNYTAPTNGTYIHTPGGYSFYGDILINGRINFIFAETFTREKIKVLSISIPDKKINVNSGGSYYDTNDFLVELQKELNNAYMVNPVIDALEEIYQSSFKTAYNHLEPQEIRGYIEDAKKIRENSSFNKR